MKESNCESSLMKAYCMKVRKLDDKFQQIQLHHVLRKGNNDADALAKMAAQRDPVPNGVFVNDLSRTFNPRLARSASRAIQLGT
jgi:ribonuclease HI